MKALEGSTSVRQAPMDVNQRLWVGLMEDELPIGTAINWATLPTCGAVVTFSGTVRSNADEGEFVESIDYESYSGPALARMHAIAISALHRWPDLGRVAMLHRVGEVLLAETSVCIVVSAPHRPLAYLASRFCIDVLKETVPIWKHEHLGDGRAQSVSGSSAVSVESAAAGWTPTIDGKE